MERQRHPTRLHVDADGVRIESARRRWPAVLAGIAAAIAVLYFVVRRRATGDLDDAQPAQPKVVRREHALGPPPAPTIGRAHVIPQLRPTAPPETPETDESKATPAPTALPKDPAAHTVVPLAPEEAAEIGPTPPPSDYGWKGPAGTALFPPPGTNPPKPGIIVPDDFELPAGYVRYHQTTDDGTELPAILAFHPDYQLVDENGQPVPLPPDLVVPPEMAPPGIPLEILKIPETVYPSGPPEEEVERFLKEHPEVLTDGMSPDDIERLVRQQRDAQAPHQK